MRDVRVTGGVRGGVGSERSILERGKRKSE